MIKLTNNSLRYFFDIKEILGFQIYLSILDDFGYIYSNAFRKSSEKSYLVRDIPVKERFYKTHKIPFFNIKWNLLNPDSDKILNIARSKLIQETKQKHDNILIKDIIPKVLDLLWKALSKDEYLEIIKSNGIDNSKISLSLYHVYQTAKLNNINFEIPETFKYLAFPLNSIIHTDSREPVSFFEYIQSKELTFLTSNRQFTSAEDFDKYVSNFNEAIKNTSKNKLIVLYFEYFQSQIKGFKLTRINKVNTETTNDSLTLLDYELTDNVKCVEVESSTRQLYLRGIFKKNPEAISFRREIINSIVPYHSKLAVSDVHYQYHLAYYSSAQSYIISPFKSSNESELLIQSYKQLINSNDKEGLMKEIRRNDIEELIPKKLSDWIIENSSTKNHIDRSAILDAYSELIAEALLLN
ncbi:MAG: hypothetical protein ACO1OF_02245 [Adhaeribacter sp.]